jgi:hypothetical protein
VAPSITVLKTLFALSGNSCFYRGCEEKLTDPAWQQVNADVAHICGEKPTAPRFDRSMSDQARNDFSNLMLLCPGCHRRIDRLRPQDHSVDTLREMKAQHEQRADTAARVDHAGLRWWRDEEAHQRAAIMLLEWQFAIRVTEPETSQATRPGDDGVAETALPITPGKSRTIGQAEEQDTARSIAPVARGDENAGSEGDGRPVHLREQANRQGRRRGGLR